VLDLPSTNFNQVHAKDLALMFGYSSVTLSMCVAAGLSIYRVDGVCAALKALHMKTVAFKRITTAFLSSCHSW
jgi:hypothetical protein